MKQDWLVHTDLGHIWTNLGVSVIYKNKYNVDESSAVTERAGKKHQHQFYQQMFQKLQNDLFQDHIKQICFVS